MFVVIEGPNGVGKTTVCSALADALVDSGTAVHITAEPTRSPLGAAIRELETSMPPHALALACAADRYDHVAREITPQLEVGACVVCDRYVPSSLVLQRLDGFDIEWIWGLNASVTRPDLTIYLTNDPATIRARLDQRNRHSRFESDGSPTQELDFYRDARDFLARAGWDQATVDCRGRTPADIASEIVGFLPRPHVP